MYAVDNDIPTLSSYQWTIVEKVVQLLSPFEEISKESSNRTSTISMIIPTILALRLFLLKLPNILVNLVELFQLLKNSVHQLKKDLHDT